MSGLAELGNLWHTIRAWLFPVLEDELGELDDQRREFVAVCEICKPREQVGPYRWVGDGWIAQGPAGAVQGIHRQGERIWQNGWSRAGEYARHSTSRVGQECPTYCQKG